MADDETTTTTGPEEFEGKRDDGVLTPSEIVTKHRSDQRGVRSMSGLRQRVRTDLASYHEARGWGEPSDEKVEELVREILA